MLELKTSDGDDGCSLSTLSPLGWDHGVLGRKEEKYSFRKSVFLSIYTVVLHYLNYLNQRRVVRELTKLRNLI